MLSAIFACSDVDAMVANDQNFVRVSRARERHLDRG